MRSAQKVWSSPTSHEKLVSGLSAGLEKSGKKRSLRVGARKPVPAPPRSRVAVSLIMKATEPRSVTWGAEGAVVVHPDASGDEEPIEEPELLLEESGPGVGPALEDILVLALLLDVLEARRCWCSTCRGGTR